MARESEHKREYHQYTTLKNSKLVEGKTELDPETVNGLQPHLAEKLKPEKSTKVVKYRGSTAHCGRAKERREERSWSNIHNVKLLKTRIIKGKS